MMKEKKKEVAELLIPNGLTLKVRNRDNAMRVVGNAILEPKEKENVHFKTTAELRHALLLDYQHKIKIQSEIPQEILELLDTPEELLPKDEEVPKGGVVYQDEFARLMKTVDELLTTGTTDADHEVGTHQIDGEETKVYRVMQKDENGQPYTLFEVSAPSGDANGDTEATITLMRGVDGESGGPEFIDLFNNGYGDSRLMGVRIQSRGSGELRPYVVEFNDGTGVIEVTRVTKDGFTSKRNMAIQNDSSKALLFKDAAGNNQAQFAYLANRINMANLKNDASIEIHDNGYIQVYSEASGLYVYMPEGLIVNDQPVIPLSSGTAKPIPRGNGHPHFDATTGKPIWWNGTNWVDAMGEVVE